MARKTEYKIVSAAHVEDLIDLVNSEEYLEWSIVGTIQEHAFTKLILEKEIS